MPPLLSVDRAQVAGGFVCPFIPNGHLVFLQETNVSVAAQKPEQFVNDGLGMNFLGREQREIFPQIKPRLRAKHGIRAGTRAVGLEFSVLQNMSQQIKVLNHRGKNLTTKYTKYTKRNLAA
jgi:hypothetical protein